MSQAPADPTTDPIEDPTPDPVDNPTDPVDDPADPDEDARVKRANRQAAQYRTQLRETEGKVADLQGKLDAQGDTLAKLAAVFNPDAAQGADPAEVAQQLTAEAETLRTTNRQLQAELAVHSLAADHNANPSALLDSRRFTDALHGLDPAADDYREQVAEAIKAAVDANANLRAGQVPPGRGGAEGAGSGSQTPGGVTQAEFDSWDYTKRAELYQTNPDTYRRLAGTSTT